MKNIIAIVPLLACAAPKPLVVPPPTTNVHVPASPPSDDIPDSPPTQAAAMKLPFTLEGDARASFVFLANGSGLADTSPLEANTIAFLRHRAPMKVGGSGLAFVFRLQVPNADRVFSVYDARTFAIRAVSDTHARYAWAKGKMVATTYIANTAMYVGRLQGSLPVAEHVHESSWELLCALSAKGTLVLEGVSQRLEDGECVNVPPGHKHAWQPDPGTELDAIQVYSPPGPEARFKKLAETSP